MNEIENALKHCRLFYPYSAQQCREISAIGTIREYPKGAIIFSPYEKISNVCIVVDGTIHICNIFSDGRYNLVDVLTANDVLGLDIACTKSSSSPYYAITATPAKVLVLPYQAILDYPNAPQREAFYLHMLSVVADENMRKHYRIAILSQKGLRDRVLTYLTMQAAKHNSNTFTIPFSQEDLSAFLCVNRSALSHELSLMDREGLISFRKKTFTIFPDGIRKSSWGR